MSVKDYTINDRPTEPVTTERTLTVVTQHFRTSGADHASIVAQLDRDRTPTDIGAWLVKTSIRTVTISSTVLIGK